jgi:serine/threonine protein kinase
VAPELLRQGTTIDGRHSDTYALGVIAYILAIGEEPPAFSGNVRAYIHQRCIAREFSDNFVDLVATMMHPVPQQRAHFQDHPWWGE